MKIIGDALEELANTPIGEMVVVQKQHRDIPGEVERLHTLLEEAVRHIQFLTSEAGCRFSESRYYRPEGETCREYKTWQQGVPASGCDLCEGRDFVDRATLFLGED